VDNNWIRESFDSQDLNPENHVRPLTPRERNAQKATSCIAYVLCCGHIHPVFFGNRCIWANGKSKMKPRNTVEITNNHYYYILWGIFLELMAWYSFLFYWLYLLLVLGCRFLEVVKGIQSHVNSPYSVMFNPFLGKSVSQSAPAQVS